jgi:hypothetical protein
LVRPRAPETNRTDRFETPNVCARNSTSASFARSSAAGAAMRIFSASPWSPRISVRFAPGCA